LREAEIEYTLSAEGSAGANIISLSNNVYVEISGHPFQADLEAI
jgi:hypothetical protein